MRTMIVAALALLVLPWQAIAEPAKEVRLDRPRYENSGADRTATWRCGQRESEARRESGSPVDDMVALRGLQLVKAYEATERGDFDLAQRLVKMFVEQGVPEAELLLGLMAMDRHVAHLDVSKGERLIESSAVKGCPYSQTELAFIRAEQGNWADAYRWATLAASANDSYAGRLRRDIQDLHPEAVAEGEQRAADFKPATW